MQPTQFTTLQPIDIRRIVFDLPRALRDMLIQEPSLFLAGGCIRSIISGERISDFDLFTTSKDRCEELATRLLEYGKYTRKFSTHNAITLVGRGPAVQFITRWTYMNPVTLIEQFDFTIAQAVIWFDQNTNTWMSLCAPSYYADLAAKRLVYTAHVRSEDAGSSLLRARKFLRRGYFIAIESFGAVIARCVMGAREVRNTGINEPHLARLITALLLEVDPNAIRIEDIPVDGVPGHLTLAEAQEQNDLFK